MALCTIAEASVSSPTRMASSVFLLISSEGSSPNGSSPDLRSGFRQRSKISRNAPLLARSPRKPSSSLISILKLSTSTDGRRVAPWPAILVVTNDSSAIGPCPGRKPEQRTGPGLRSSRCPPHAADHDSRRTRISKLQSGGELQDLDYVIRLSDRLRV